VAESGDCAEQIEQVCKGLLYKVFNIVTQNRINATGEVGWQSIHLAKFARGGIGF
jgi:hypothetical protein